MFLQLKGNTPGGLCPPSSWRLSGDLGVLLFNKNHGLRHPFGIYNVSLEKIEKRLRKVITDLDPFLKVENADQIKRMEAETLLDEQEHLLYSLAEHFDDCQSIFDCFFSDKSVRHKNKRVKLFFKRVKPYRDHVDKLVNAMKHRNAGLRFMVQTDQKQIVPGYFLECVHSDGSIGCDPAVHKDGGAFSFSRDLRLHFVWLFATSDYLAKVLDHLGVAKYPDTAMGCQWVAELGKRLAVMTDTYYPNEVIHTNPWIVYAEERGGCPSLTLSLGEQSPKPKSFVSGGEILTVQSTVLYKGDGASKTFRVPYSAPASK